MTEAPPPSAARRWSRLLLLAAVALSAVPLIVLGRIELSGYDAFWHVFVARQDDWASLWEEIRRSAHPPLFYLVLKAAIALLGTGLWVYRLVSILAILGSTWLVGRIVERTARNPWLPPAAAVVFGGSLATVSIGLEVRAYALGTVFMLWACRALLDLVEPVPAAARRRARIVFAFAASLALLTHYVAALFVLAGVVAAAIPALVDRPYRRRLAAEAGRRWPADLLTFGVPLAVLAIEYVAHIAAWTERRFNHVPSFLYDPAREGAVAFVWRNTKALFELFVPPFDHRPFASTLIVTGPSLSDPVVAALAVSALAAIAWLALGPAGAADGRSIARRVPPTVLAGMVALLVAAALLGQYPYGGPIRHQYFLFPFVVIVLALLLDEVASRSGRRLGVLLVALFALGGLLNTANWMREFRVTRGYLMQTEVDRFRQAFPAPQTVYVDQFNLIHLFTHTHERRWRYLGTAGGDGAIDLWRVGGEGAGGFTVCRPRGQWLLDLSKPAVFQHMAVCLEAAGGDTVTVFRPQQKGVPAAWPADRTREVVTAAAAPAGLEPREVVVSGDDVYASFGRL